MNSSHPTFFPGTFNDPSMAFLPRAVYDKDIVDSQMILSPSYVTQPDQPYYHGKNQYYQADTYTQEHQQPLGSPHYSIDSPLSSEWQSWPPSLAGSDASSTRRVQSHSRSSSSEVSCYSVTKPSLLSWPVECFVTPDPSLASNDNELLSGRFTLLSTSGTPDLLYSTSSSAEDGPNVFDIQFGQSLKATTGGVYGYPGECSSHSSPQSAPPSPVSREASGRRRQAHHRTPSPSSSDIAPSSTADYRRRFPCLLPGCERRFTSRYTLKVHMEAHKPKPKVTFPCTHGCSERFSRQHDRLRHEVAKHGKICEFLCDDCGRFFSTGKTLGNHKCPVAAGGTRWVHSN
ncbi:hypothetical protein L218DRAFT_932646 [Marasmius fiardii PR-910]|nr:hypothetical protein L218DRAFT_932646 [Marasmius fiardii PR-910]